jgi:hypothetical protein
VHLEELLHVGISLGGMDGRIQARATRVDGSNVMVFCGAGRVAEDQTDRTQ